MKNFIERWRNICEQNNIEHLNIPRGMLFAWGLFVLTVQTLTVLLSSRLFLPYLGILLPLITFLFRQYYLIWKRYYSLAWPILVQILVVFAAIYIKVRFI